jgi:hypothetical protein
MASGVRAPFELTFRCYLSYLHTTHQNRLNKQQNTYSRSVMTILIVCCIYIFFFYILIFALSTAFSLWRTHPTEMICQALRYQKSDVQFVFVIRGNYVTAKGKRKPTSQKHHHQLVASNRDLLRLSQIHLNGRSLDCSPTNDTSAQTPSMPFIFFIGSQIYFPLPWHANIFRPCKYF